MGTAELALVVGAYAALVSSGTLAWQVYIWRKSRRTAVTTEVRHSIEPERRVIQAEDYDRPEVSEQVFEYQLTVVVANRGETTQYVERIGIALLDDPQTFDFEEPDDKTLQPGKSLRHSWRVERLDFSLDEGFDGFAALGTGELVKSRPQRLDANLIAMRDA